MRGFILTVVRSVAILLPAVLVAPTAAQDDPATRVWKDKTGKFRVEATFEGVSADKVKLRRKDDGRTIEIALSSLGEAELGFVRALAPHVFKEPGKKLLTASALETAAQLRRYAIDALAMYDRFLADASIAPAEKLQATKARDRWVAAASAKKIRVATKWYTIPEYRDLVSAEIALLRATYDFRTVTDWDTLEAKLKQASLLNPSSIRAEFIHGFLAALQGRPENDVKERYVRRSAAEAEDRFTICVRRLVDYQADLTNAERANLAACYNNLALACMRQRKYAEALRHWQRCLDSAPADEAVLHNLGQFDAVVKQSERNKAGILLSDEEAAQLGRLSRALRGIPVAYDKSRGWRYMPPVPADVELEVNAAIAAADVGTADAPGADLVLAGGGTGFVVGKGMVVTNRHVVSGYAGFKVRRDGEDNTAARPATLVVASDDPKLDLALLTCQRLDAPSLAFSADVLKLSTEVRTLGFPLSDILGTNIKVTGGVVTSVPPLRATP